MAYHDAVAANKLKWPRKQHKDRSMGGVNDGLHDGAQASEENWYNVSAKYATFVILGVSVFASAGLLGAVLAVTGAEWCSRVVL